MLLTSSWLLDATIFVFLIIFALHKYVSRNYDYWKKKGVFYIKPKPFVGNLYDVISFKKTMAHWQQDIYNSSTDEPYVGIFVFDQPLLTLRSPELIKEVLVKHFNHFADRTMLAPEHDQAIANTLVFAKGQNWRSMRSKITPAFTSGKLKSMFFIVKDIGHKTTEYIRKNLGEIETKGLSSRYGTEVIARTCFGITSHSFDEGESEFQMKVRLFFAFAWKTAFCQSAYFFMHSLVNMFRLEFADPKLTEYFKNVFWNTITQREKTTIKGNDLIDIIVDLRSNKEFRDKIKFEGDKVLAQPILFLAAGIETTSQAISFTLYELCLHPQIQNKLRDEIINYLEEHKEIEYDSLKNLKYLEMCILETLRKYPAVHFIDRRCNASFTIPGTDVVIDEGTPVYIPVLGLHYDEKYFPEPHEYIPERFADKSVYNQDGLYYLPFGEGPRICLGERFAMMNVKIALINILSQFVIEPTTATPVPVIFSKKSFGLESEVGLPMRYVEYKQ